MKAKHEDFFGLRTTKVLAFPGKSTKEACDLSIYGAISFGASRLIQKQSVKGHQILFVQCELPCETVFKQTINQDNVSSDLFCMEMETVDVP